MGTYVNKSRWGNNSILLWVFHFIYFGIHYLSPLLRVCETMNFYLNFMISQKIHVTYKIEWREISKMTFINLLIMKI